MKTEIVDDTKPAETKVGDLFTHAGETYLRIDTKQGAAAMGHAVPISNFYAASLRDGRIWDARDDCHYKPLTGTGKDGALQLKLK